MGEKDLKPEIVEKRSSGAITEGYVRSIVSEKAKNPSIAKLKALARGLDVSEEELFRVARGLPLEGADEGEEETDFRQVINLAQASTTNRTLRQLLLEVTKLSPEMQKEAVLLLKMLNGGKSEAVRKAKRG
jgi:transcriptional regulator with XRE-family HTH domain